MTDCIEDWILKAEDCIEDATQYVNNYLKKMYIWDGFTDQNMVLFKRERAYFLLLMMVLSIKKSFFCHLIWTQVKIWFIFTGNIKYLI